MYNAQAQCILDLDPDTLCLEQVAHIMNVDKSAVTELITQLEAKYVMYSSIIRGPHMTFQAILENGR